ncbi:MAG TPA: site-specific integrase [Actinomycetota bacterium]|nr:site-specific integrase [Actinomycetota bacterium]
MTKRRSLGSVRNIGKDRWLVQVSGGIDADGRRVRLTRRVHGSETDAERVKGELLAEVDDGHLHLQGSLDLQTYLQTRWLPYKKAKGGSPLTYLNYESKIRNHVLPYSIARLELAKISPFAVDQWLTKLRGSKGKRGALSEQTLLHVFATLRAAMRQAIVWRLITFDPTSAVEAPHPDRYRGHTLTADQALQIIEACQTRELGAAHAIALGAGLRRGEVAGLAWSDFQFGDRTLISVNRQVIEVPGAGALLRPPKTRESNGTMLLPGWCVEIVRAHELKSKEQRLATGLRPAPGIPDLLFLDRDGHPIPPQRLSKDFRIMRKELELPYMRLHDMRHGMARLMRKAGVGLDVIQQRLRHTRITTTQYFYTDIDMDLDEQAVERFDEILGRSSKLK